MIEVQRCNVKIPNLEINQVGFCYNVTGSIYNVKTIHGVFSMKHHEITFFEERYLINNTW